jgi:hypothetical protein
VHTFLLTLSILKTTRRVYVLFKYSILEDSRLWLTAPSPRMKSIVVHLPYTNADPSLSEPLEKIELGSAREWGLDRWTIYALARCLLLEVVLEAPLVPVEAADQLLLPFHLPLQAPERTCQIIEKKYDMSSKKTTPKKPVLGNGQRQGGVPCRPA